MASQKIIEKVQKVLRLAKGNGHEAEAAKLRAKELMDAHGIDAAIMLDGENVLEVVDDRCDNRRKLLAEKVAFSRDVAPLSNGTALAMRGGRAAVANAKALYKDLASLADTRIASADLEDLNWAGEIARAVYRIAFWSIYAQVLSKRLTPEITVRPPTTTPAGPAPTKEEAKQAAEKLKSLLSEDTSPKQAPTSSESDHQLALTALINLLAQKGYPQETTYALIARLQSRANASAYEGAKHVPISTWEGIQKRAPHRFGSTVALLGPRQE